MASELPFEITRRIADFIQRRDRAQSCLVCKAWLPVFQESLFEEIVINDYIRFAESVDISCSRNKLLQRYGKKTRTLHISENTLINGQQILALQQYLPHLHRFKWDSTCIDENSFVTDPGWNLWSSITYLEVNVENYDSSTLPHVYYSIISNLGQLKRLEFKSIFNAKMFKQTVEDIEFLNDKLPKLTYLSLGVQLESINQRREANA
ncbi:hypothetical protein PHYBLDRAFT_65428 [Phycomyces blakesleeanus NRRL 1555(-)]|uniref:F-box domain-containing protein n=1 Tax=Phycomyces blakesleeanus (strain ATCC 8743b / DSM 1359 / FGSC 10004 / NBRC 33097 / NRRL 1555) TaxID=763407 RepID=A0A162U0N3_PHYB8|nr:hypothetical protein PHYBLDRAFT_65428 [Phycomyces blakesleeanus NRRL 1555(-)]OAD72532.1 hypothetical protein PHYBLDRAFT_65428 [Phycomyces blakesleeanus NRRL 1555(-)]|eukprot:XP_018290572.1 hypothetical protein PHYBLDRAFT_65428 [Phycomyces blakesleeanus NRRL 1555(-)]